MKLSTHQKCRGLSPQTTTFIKQERTLVRGMLVKPLNFARFPVQTGLYWVCCGGTGRGKGGVGEEKGGRLWKSLPCKC